jgi:hypothetical protein
MEDWGAISGDTYEQYQRDFSEDPECLITDKCQWLEYDLYTEAQWLSGLIKTEMNSHGEIRWVESEGEMVLIQRWWMVGPLEVSPDLGLDFNGQYYLHISIPDGIGMIRSQTLWFDVDYGDFIFDEDWGRNQIIDTMKKENQILDDWLSEQL